MSHSKLGTANEVASTDQARRVCEVVAARGEEIRPAQAGRLTVARIPAGWATSRKSLPTADVAAAGGWSDVGTLLRCYQQPDDATMLAVMSHEQRPVEQQKGA